MASVILRGKRWSALIWDPARERQIWIKLSMTIDGKKAAKAEAAALEARLKNGSPLPEPATKPKGWKDIALELVVERESRISEEWRERLEIFIGRMEDSLGDLPALAVTEDMAREHALFLEGLGLEASARRKELSFCRAVFRRTKNPVFDVVTLPTEPKNAPKFISVEDFAKLIAAAPPERAFRYQLLVFSGARGIEVRGLRWKDVDLKSKSITLANAQKGTGTNLTHRRVPIPAPLLKALKARKDEREPDPDDFLLDHVSEDSRPNNWQRDMTADAEKAGIGHCSPHMLRHSFCSWLAQSGSVTLLEIRDLAGHESTRTTEKYAHLLPTANHAAAKALENYCKTTAKKKAPRKSGPKS